MVGSERVWIGRPVLCGEVENIFAVDLRHYCHACRCADGVAVGIEASLRRRSILCHNSARSIRVVCRKTRIGEDPVQR